MLQRTRARTHTRARASARVRGTRGTGRQMQEQEGLSRFMRVLPTQSLGHSTDSTGRARLEAQTEWDGRLAERVEEKGRGRRSTLRGSKRPVFNQTALVLFRGQPYEDCPETGCRTESAYGPFRAVRCHNELKQATPEWNPSEHRWEEFEDECCSRQ